MFAQLPETRGERVVIIIDGVAHPARTGDTVAAAMLAVGVVACRTTSVDASPRGPFCLMGVCFDCLVTIDGRPNRQGCLVPVVEGMRIETQHGARPLDGFDGAA